MEAPGGEVAPLTPVPATTDRRRFLRQAAGLVGAAASTAVLGTLPACAEHPPAPRETTTSRPPPSLPPTSVLDDSAWAALATMLDGTLVLPSAPAYGAAKLVYNQRFAGADPAAVAYCASPADVQRCIDFARTHGITPTPRSGGHSYAGYSTGTGLVVDVSPLHSVMTDTSSLRAVVGSGTQLIDLYRQLSNAGVLLPGGSCPTVGIAGLTLGGGIGVVGRKYGLTCDNLVAVDLVTADGRLRRCTADENADLFWASRGGGGGNFGIATSFTFAVHRLPSLSLFTINWPWAAAASVLGAWQQWTATAPDELWSNCQLAASGPDGPGVRSNGVFVGSPGDLTAVLQPFLAQAGRPDDQFVGPEQYLHAMLVEAGCEDLSVAQCHLTGQNPTATLPRSSFAATSAFVADPLSDAGIAAVTGSVVRLADADPELGGGLVFDAYGGVINEVAPDATAFVHRRELCAVPASTSWSPAASPSTVQAAEAWLAQTAAALAPFVGPGAYQNYIDPTLADWALAYYGSNLPRLVEVKRRYDPDDVLHFAQSIPTARD
ncbi:MAG: FAD-binding oxidoreductase [Acidimicrobiales bacterium]